MNQKEILETIDRYNQRLKEFGVGEQALGWGEKGRAKLRYEILLSQWNFNSASVVDFGCGFGDLYTYMLKKGFTGVRYMGIDINPQFISMAKKKHPDCNFLLLNLTEENLTERFDFILSSGVFNHHLSDNFAFIEKCFEKFNLISEKGFAVNFLSDRADAPYDNTYHANPSRVLELAYKYSNNVILRNDYMPFEFTIFVNKFSSVSKRSGVYMEYERYV
jgi:trans-aconitate methyltransferase